MRTHLAIAALFVLIGAPTYAQQPDARWSPWLGCWQMLDERVRDANPSGADAVAAARRRGLGSATNVSVCVAPTAQPAVVMLSTRASGEPAFEQTIAADGTDHPVSEARCAGSQRAEWSADGRRLFARAELRCENQPVRTISGLTMITAGGTWLDVQAIDVGGRTNVRVRQYRRTTFSAGTLDAAARSLTVAAVKEASTKVAAPALEAALIESGARFNVNRTALVELDDANVPDSVIDLMVALSYPDKFQVERRIEQSLDLFTTSSSYADADWSGYGGFGYPYFSSYPGYYGNYGYYYSPFGYPYAGLYAPYYYYGSSSIVGGGTVTPPAPDTGEGRAISGVGYTRIRPRDAVPVDSGGSSTSSGRSSGRSTATSSGGYSQSGGDSSGSSSGGSSSGSGGGGGGNAGGGGGGGRTAQPR